MRRERHHDNHQPVCVMDRRCRTITLQRPGALALSRLVEVLGESARNQLYFAIMAPLLYVQDIDGHHVPLPATKADLEALLDQLEEDGMEAVMTALREHEHFSAQRERVPALLC